MAGSFGPRVLELADHLAQWSETKDSPMHVSHTGSSSHLMTAVGIATEIDGVGNVIDDCLPPNPVAKIGRRPMSLLPVHARRC